MLSFFLPFFVLPKEYVYPRITYLLVGYDHSQKEADEYIEWFIKKGKDNCKRWDETGEFEPDENLEQCLAIVESMITFKYSESSKINNALTQISTSTDFLYIHGCNLTSIDFTNLKKQMIVQVSPYCPYESRELEDKNERMLSIHRNLQKIIGTKRINNIEAKSKHINLEFDESELISINGNIKDKVSNLLIINAYLKFINNDININTLQLLYCQLHEDTMKIRTDNFITEEGVFTRNNELIQNADLIQVKQLLYLTFFQRRYVDSYQIEYKEDRWEINNIEPRSQYDNFSFPYSKASVFGVISEIPKIKISYDKSVTFTSFKPINISMSFHESYAGSIVVAKVLEENQIKIDDSDFDGFDFTNVEKPKITLVYDKEQYSFNNENTLISIESSFYQTFVPSTSGDDDGSEGGNNPKNKTGMIVGIVVAVVVVVGVVIVVVIIVIRKKKADGSISEGQQ